MRVFLALAALVVTSLPGVAAAAPSDQATPSGTPPVPVAASPGSGLVIQSDMVIGAPGPCVLQSRFHPGDRVVFRAKVYDAQTGQLAPNAQVVVRLEDGTTLNMQYGAHPPPNVGPSTDEYWTAVWAIRPDTPMGIVRYSIEATDGGRTGRFEPFENMTSLLTIVPAES
ncbi:MAG TPA: hypothetical protein VFE37_27080 [Chloroflexota bacterium]|nr:hypothetical protein [Chloroflexota bacterium]